MPDPVHRIGARVEARPDELLTLGQTLRYVRGRDIVWARLAPPFLSKYTPLTPERQIALWAFWAEIAAGATFSPEDIQARGIVIPSPLTPADREAIFDLWREAAAGTVLHPIRNYHEIHPSHWSFEARLILSFHEKQGETTGDFGPFIAEVERVMGDMLFRADELIRAFPRRTPFQLAGLTEIGEPTASKALAPQAEAGGKSKKPKVAKRPPAAQPEQTKKDKAITVLRRWFSEGLPPKPNYKVLQKRFKEEEDLTISPAHLKLAIRDGKLKRQV